MSEKDGGPAFPCEVEEHYYSMGEKIRTVKVPGMGLRDFFAATLPTDSVQEITFRSLSRTAQEELIGRKYPREPADPGAERIAYQLEKMRFQIDVDAAIRFIHADSMLEARKS